MERLGSILAAALAIIGATLGVLIAAGAGALIAVIMSADPFRARVWTGVGGMILALIGAPALAAWFDLSDHALNGIALLLGLYGMAAASEGVLMIKDGTLRRVLLTIFRKPGSSE